ncbi:hypothetical protein H1S01_13600 [Heliobacterium chlorum]|uniref:Uncharacterized protein n=1 Tax=Heliobacterium chlorum TaxID=2698 RepID=A0ABR7T446_HELCL|nr:hypothetical protein [Heliobacterium chlorum]MBC9785537.1 hypothetical protein [Heliobacterium chlorum]
MNHLPKSGHVTETIGHGSFAGKPSANFDIPLGVQSVRTADRRLKPLIMEASLPYRPTAKSAHPYWRIRPTTYQARVL